MVGFAMDKKLAFGPKDCVFQKRIPTEFASEFSNF
jgi:hypothetical protein